MTREKNHSLLDVDKKAWCISIQYNNILIKTLKEIDFWPTADLSIQT